MRLLVAVLLAAFMLAGAAAATTPPPKFGNAKNGRKLFVAHDCGACHLMAAANALSPSGIGPDLDTSTKSYTAIVANITKGGKGMTGYRNTLTTTQILDLATFVYKTSLTNR